MTVQICENREEWNGHLVRASNNHQFLQSWEWGEFQREVGHEPVRVQVVEDGIPIDQLQGFFHPFMLGTRYLYAPRFTLLDAESLPRILEYLQKTGVIFIRLEPGSEVRTAAPERPLPTFSTAHRQPAHTMMIDVRLSDEELLRKMHAKTRYNIHLARRKGVEIRNEKNSDIFWALHEQTTRRDEFRGHSESYYKKMLKSLITHQLTAYHNDQPIATMILVIFGNTATYLHGASSNIHRDVMAPYLLQWEAMKLAKSHECEQYDLWGVSGPAQPESQHAATFHTYTWDALHKFSQVTRFKAGFGGPLVSYPDACEVVVRPRVYSLYRMLKKVL